MNVVESASKTLPVLELSRTTTSIMTEYPASEQNIPNLAILELQPMSSTLQMRPTSSTRTPLSQWAEYDER